MALTTSATNFLSRLGVKHPIISAPMAGFGTPKLTAAVANAGGLAMFGAGQNSKESLSRSLHEIKHLIQIPQAKFGVNLFVPSGFHLDQDSWTPEQRTSAQEAATRHAAALQEMCKDVPASPLLSMESCEANFAGQLDALLEEHVEVASFHFGWPAADDVKRLRSAGIYLIGNATSVSEAKALERLGADAIIAQGAEAGGHRGTFLDAGNYQVHSMIGLFHLVSAIKEAVSVPVIAAGGIMDGADVAAALRAGASAAQLGTAFLTTAESGAPAVHKRHLLLGSDHGAPTPTVVTQCFTGKPARALVNQWMQDMDDIQGQLPNCFNGMPAGRTLQGVAVPMERADVMYMWAGQEYTRCRAEMGAADLMAALVTETEAAFRSRI